MLLPIQKEITSRGWISEEEFADLIALSQAAPGLLAVNISIFSGYRVRGVPGAVAATLGSCLSPFIIILLVAVFFTGIADEPVVQAVFKGMRPAVVALIAVPMIKMARSGCRRWWQWILLCAAMAAVALLHISPVYILICVIAVSLAVAAAMQHKG